MMQLRPRPHQLPPFANRAGVIKRVIRVLGRSMCAICRSQYDEEKEAVSCLGRCWEELLALDPVIFRRKGDEQRFVCRFCARPHLMRTAALLCAEECRKKSVASFEAEQQQLLDEGQKELPPPPRRKWRSRPALQLVRMTKVAPPARSKAADPDIGMPIHESVQVATVNADVRLAPKANVLSESDVRLAPKGSVIDDSTEAKKKPDKVFYRDGAEYVCSICHKKYYTRIEVQSCFDAHPDGG